MTGATGDQGMMFGFACDETENMRIQLSRAPTSKEGFAEVRKMVQ